MKDYRSISRMAGSNFNRLILLLSLSLCLSLSPPTARAQESPITASVNSTHFSTDELVILSVTVTDDSPLQPRPILPRLDGLAVVDLDISTD
ncbi:MAG: hypothetical protein KJ077_19510, partial [Anaerolineae bacterium]|nr:hypothetical protein [Anaerolineae bacterium]